MGKFFEPEISQRLAGFWLIILIAIAFFVRFRVGYYQELNFDGCGYVMHAWSISQGKLSTPYWSKGIDHYYQPLYPALIALFQFFIKDWIWSAKLVNNILGALLLIPFYLLGKRIYGSTGAIFSSALLVSYPILVELSSNGASEPMFLLGFGFGLYFFQRFLEEKKLMLCVLIGTSFGISYLARTQALVFVITAGIILLSYSLLKKIPLSTAISGLCVIFATFYIFALPYDIYCLKKHGIYSLRARQEFFKKVAEPGTAGWFIEERDLDKTAEMLLNFRQAKERSLIWGIFSHPGEYFHSVFTKFRIVLKLAFQWGTLIPLLVIILLFLSGLSWLVGKNPSGLKKIFAPGLLWMSIPAIFILLSAPALIRYFCALAPLLALFASAGLLFLREVFNLSSRLKALNSPGLIFIWILPLLVLFPTGKLRWLASQKQMEAKEKGRREIANWVKSKIRDTNKIIMSEHPFAPMVSGNYWYIFPIDYPARIVRYAQAQAVSYILAEEHLFSWMDAPLELTDYFLSAGDKPGLKFISSYPEGERFPGAVLYEVEKPEPEPSLNANLILIVLNSLRPDHLSCYGYTQKTSPFLGRLAEKGVRFENVITASVQSSFSIASLMTGTWLLGPFTITQEKSSEKPIEPELKTLADFLQQAGYQTSAFTGFSDTRAFEIVPLSGFSYFKTGFERLDNSNLEQIFSWIDSLEPSRPFFLFLNTGETGQMQKSESAPSDPQKIVKEYDDRIKKIDQSLEKIFSGLEQRNLLQEKTLVIITSDHGIEFKETGTGFDQIYDSVLKVPLILYWRGHLPQGMSIPNLSRTIDILPGIMGMLNMEIPAQAQGVPFQVYLNSKIEMSALSESLSVDSQGKKGLVQALRTPDWLFCQSPDQVMLFDLSKDPEQKTNLLTIPSDYAEEHLQKVHKLLHKSISAYNFYNIRHLEKFSSAKGARQ